ncbi:sialidase family protein [Agromyces silvae]|uniref:sialidase family protein n=1 Tax=Agromyces silvae TaxID=3388266 RepID=UPI00280A546E|nr:sialidase family protein [Agromyces protaetiae]
MTRSIRPRTTISIGAVAALILTLSAPVGPAAAADPAIHIASSGVIHTGSATAQVVISTLAKSDDGDLVAFYNTGNDGAADVGIMTTRSEDDGATWTTPSQFIAPSNPASRISAGSATTLDDGTMLLPYTLQTIHQHYLNRETDLYLARSADGGITWTGHDAPVTVTPDWYGAFQFGELVELADGTLLMPIWGSAKPPASTDYANLNPEPLLSGVLRSTDAGLTWGEFSAFDPFLDAPLRPLNVAWMPAGLNEATIVELRDGRLMASMRYDSRIFDRTGYLTYSDDGGRTWSEPVVTGLAARGPAAFVTSCSEGLPGAASKVLYTTAEGSALKMYTTYDGGTTFGNVTNVQLPTGVTNPIYADAEYLSDGRLFVLFTGNHRLAYNILEESDATECANELAASTAASEANPTLYIDRAGAADWDYPYAHRRTTVAADATMASLRTTALSLSSAGSGSISLTHGGIPLPLTGTVSEAGLSSGDVVVVGAKRLSDPELRVGLVDYDDRPLTRRAANFDDELGFNAGWDIRRRSLVVNYPLASGEVIGAIHLRDSNSSNAITAANIEVYTSPDGVTWTPRTGFTVSKATVGGRSVVTVDGVDADVPYAKIRFSDTPGGYTLVTQSHADVTVTIE